MVMPVVGNLTDDNGDGRVDDADVPDVVFTTFEGSHYMQAGYIRALSGDDGHELWGSPGVNGAGGVAIGDADGDGFPEVYSVNTSGYLVAFDHNGVQLWTCPSSAPIYAFPSIANIDGLGKAEILAGSSVCDSDGNLLATATLNHDRIPYLLDTDQDGQMEIVSGAGLSRTTNGSTIWAGPGGYSASANFDGDNSPEHVVAHNGNVYLLDDDGTQLWVKPQKSAGGGPPTIADFDGDGAPEIAVAGADYYTVFEGDGTIKWSKKIQDHSSEVTGSSVFDFEGGGAAEVIYASEINLWVYDGSTGDVLLQESGHASGTLQGGAPYPPFKTFSKNPSGQTWLENS
jgi:hypothetical protein